MPDERAPHKRTWMAFVARPAIWLHSQIPEVKRNLALIAKTIAHYEPVFMLVSPHDYDEAFSLTAPNSHQYPINLIKCEVDD